MEAVLAGIKGKVPLSEYPWSGIVETLLEWTAQKDSHIRAFCFDVVMSLAYADSTSGLESYIETCPNLAPPFNAHLGFINLCAPCYEKAEKWVYQKAGKPSSGALGKLSSEIILKFIEKTSKHITQVISVGGADSADAVLCHKDKTLIFAEVKSAPLMTYPIVFALPKEFYKEPHKKVILTSSQLKTLDAGLYMHNKEIIPLGKADSLLWPFQGAIDFITSSKNENLISGFVETWLSARRAYVTRDRNNKMFFLANASGSPPIIAKQRDGWPSKESISDSKTSAGMDRTDDIKKGIYQALKIGSEYKEHDFVKTALISNLPAYRHGEEYVQPFIPMLWGNEDDLETLSGINVLRRDRMKRVFDFIITIEEPILRGFPL
jgi:hypothetical protein